MSACYEDWAHGVAGDPDVVSLIDELPSPKRQPNLVFSAARFQGVTDRAVPPVPRLLHAALDRGPGDRDDPRHATNEAGAMRAARAGAGRSRWPAGPARGRDRRRAVPLPRPVRLPLSGASASSIGADGPSPVVLDCARRGPVPVPERRPTPEGRGAEASTSTRSTCGVPTTSRGWTRSIWPEHDDRRARLRAAAAIAAIDPPHVVAGDLNERLARRGRRGAR